MQVIDFTGNQLTMIPHGISLMTSLKKCDFSNNSLLYLPITMVLIVFLRLGVFSYEDFIFFHTL